MVLFNFVGNRGVIILSYIRICYCFYYSFKSRLKIKHNNKISVTQRHKKRPYYILMMEKVFLITQCKQFKVGFQTTALGIDIEEVV